MDLVSRFAYNSGAVALFSLILALLGGITLFALFSGLFYHPKGKPRQVKQSVKTFRRLQFNSVQKRLDRAQIEVTAFEYIKRSLLLGIPLGFGMYLLVGSVVLTAVGVVAGFIFTWAKLEQERDVKQVRYNKQLATACDTIRTSYGVNPSMKRALETVATYSQSPLKEDFQEILVAASQERFVQGLNEIAERRRSIVFDTVANSLIRANEATGEVDEMLRRLAESTRANVAVFEDAITSQVNARSNVQWGTYGPWVIFCGFRAMSFVFMAAGGGVLIGPMVSFYSSLGGNIVVLAAALISIYLYRHCMHISQRGLVVRRVHMSSGISLRGQRTLDDTVADNLLSGQSHQVAPLYNR